MSTIDQAQIRASPPAEDRRPNHWATPPTNNNNVTCPTTTSSAILRDYRVSV